MHLLAMTFPMATFVHDLLHNVEHGFAVYGYLIVFVPILLECAGVPLPGETVLLAAGVAAQHGVLSLPLVIVVAATAAILGDNLGYWVGRRGGRPLLFRHGRILRIGDTQIAVLDSFFARYGARTVFFGRWVAFLRVWAAVTAGTSQMPWRTFLPWNALGGIAWAATMSTVAYVFSASAGAIGSALGLFGWVLALVVAVGVSVFVWRFQHRASKKAELDAAIEKVRQERAAYDARRAGGGGAGGGGRGRGKGGGPGAGPGGAPEA